MSSLVTPEPIASRSVVSQDIEDLRREFDDFRAFLNAEHWRIVKWVVGGNLLMAAATWATMMFALIKGYV